VDQKIDAFILAGEGRGSQSVLSQNKALLTIKGFPLFLYVVAALDQVERINHIYLVGPRAALSEALEKGRRSFGIKKSTEVIEQQGDLLENLICGFSYSLAGRPGIGRLDPHLYELHHDRVGLFLSADVPLLVPEEIDEFLRGCDMKSYDYCLGVTSEEFLRPFYPSEGRPGIRMDYFYLAEKAYRINNLHLARPFKISRLNHIQDVYTYRYQRRLGNIVGVAAGILRTRRWLRGMFYYGVLRVANLFSSLRLTGLARFPRGLLQLEAIEKTVSEVLGTRFKTVETSFGGAALDVDSEAAYRAVGSMFEPWRAYQGSLAQEKRTVGAPLSR